MREQVLAWLGDSLPHSRLQHILRVEQTAALLASDRDVDVEKAAAPGLGNRLMHDPAKNFTAQQLLETAAGEGLELDGAIVARDRFGFRGEEILQAIENHTLGRPEMSRIGCIVFVPDSIEPGRGNTSELEELRLVSRENLDRAVWLFNGYQSFNSPANDIDRVLGNANSKPQPTISPG